MVVLSEDMARIVAESAFNAASAKWAVQHSQGFRTACLIESADIFEALSNHGCTTSRDAEIVIEDALALHGFYEKALAIYEKHHRIFEQRLGDVTLSPAVKQQAMLGLYELARKISLSKEGRRFISEDEQKVILSVLALNKQQAPATI